MKRMMIFIFLLLALALEGKAQELIGIAGGGFFRNIKTDYKASGDFEYVEGRLMFGHKFRYGPMANYTWVYLNQDRDNFQYKGRFYTLGLSVDNWGKAVGISYYFWINSGVRWSYDRGASHSYHSWQDDRLFLVQGGLRLTKLFNDWLGNSLFIAEWQRPIKKGDARYSVTPGIVRAGTPYEKESFRLVYENGIKKFPIFVKKREIRLEPIIHLGYGLEKASDRQFIEYGGGFAVGYFKEWHHELFKIKAFRRQDLGGYNPQTNDGSKPPSLQIEIVLNLLNWKLKK